MFIVLGTTLGYSQTRFSMPILGQYSLHSYETDSSYILISKKDINIDYHLIAVEITKQGDSLNNWRINVDSFPYNNTRVQQQYIFDGENQLIVGGSFSSGFDSSYGFFAKMTER